jgi:hypothetical protein
MRPGFLLLVLSLVLVQAQAAGPQPRDGAPSDPAQPEATQPQPDAAKTPGTARRARPAGAVRHSQILAPVWVGNSPVEGIAPESFRATLGAREATVRGIRDIQAPLLLFVAVDFSADLILTEAAKNALVESLNQAGPNLYAALLRIPEQPMVQLDPTTDREKFANAVRSLPMSGRAGFFEMVDVIAGVTNPIVARHPVRAAVLYLTDSEIRNYRQDYTNPVINAADSRDLSRRFPDALIREKVNTLTNELLRGSVPIFVVHLNYRNDPLNEAYQTGIKRLAQATGGRSVFCRSIAEIPVAIGDMVNAIQAMGMVEVTIPEGVSGSVTLTLKHTDKPLEFRTLFEIPK